MHMRCRFSQVDRFLFSSRHMQKFREFEMGYCQLVCEMSWKNSLTILTFQFRIYRKTNRLCKGGSPLPLISSLLSNCLNLYFTVIPLRFFLFWFIHPIVSGKSTIASKLIIFTNWKGILSLDSLYKETANCLTFRAKILPQELVGKYYSYGYKFLNKALWSTVEKFVIAYKVPRCKTFPVSYPIAANQCASNLFRSAIQSRRTCHFRQKHLFCRQLLSFIIYFGAHC